MLRLWPEYPFAVAFRLAKADRWTPPVGLDKAALAALPEGKRVPLSPVVKMLAFAQMDPPAEVSEVERLTKRMQAADALFAAARDERVKIFGTRKKDQSRGRIAPEEFDNHAPTLSPQNESAIGARFVAENHADQGGHPDGVKWSDMSVEREDLGDWLGKLTTEASKARGMKGSGGRPNAVDWTVVKLEALRLMDHHGDFMPGDKAWNAQARAEILLVKYCKERFGKEPGESTLRERIPGWLTEWRDKKSRRSET